MKNQLLIALLALSTFFWYSCQREEENLPGIESPVKDEGPWSEANNSLFWRVTGNGLEEPAHLFGTIHKIAQEDLAFEQSLDSLVAISKSVMLEALVDDPAIVSAIQKRLVWPSNVNPEDAYSDAQLEKVRSLCQALNVNWQSVKHLKPIALESYLSNIILNQQIGANTSYEDQLVKRAKKSKTSVLGAESAEYVSSYLDNIPTEEVIRRLARMSDEYSEDPELVIGTFYDLVHAYLQQDLSSLHQLTFEGDEESDTYKVLVIERNTVWLDAIEENFSGRLVAVGAAHLGGKHGLVQMLKDKGYEVTPIKIAH